MHILVRRLVAGFFLVLTFPAHGLGLGELSVSSSLGQPLRASIPLQGAAAELSSACFRVQPGAANNALPTPADLRVSLEQPADKQALLRLSTKQAVNDPILGFVVTAHCEGLLQREYALLLDPAVSEQSAESLPQALPEQPDAAVKPQRPNSRPASKPQSTAAPASTYAYAPSRASGKKKKVNESRQPRLVLSGTRLLASGSGEGLSLKLDLGLPDLSRQPETPLTSIELSDENTALNHKLANLEQQLVALQKRNTELSLHSRPPEVSADGKAGGQASHWPYYLPGLFLLSGGMAWMLHRRRLGQYQGKREEEEQPNWRRAYANPAALGSAEADLTGVDSASVSRSVNQDDDFFPRAQEGAEIHDSMRDEVEVFVAHGHSSLAIRLLENHVQQAPAESPVPWLLLLDLLQREGNAAKYEETRQQCKQNFNVEIPAYGIMETASGKLGIESYPHITAELLRIWQTDQAIPYLDDLLRDNRNGSRAGFNFAAYNEIVLLRSIRGIEVPGPW